MFLLSYQKDESVRIVEWMMLREGSYGVLCRFFEKMWEKNKTFAKKLRHCLTWPPMKSFLSCFCEFLNVYFVVYIYVYIYIYIYYKYIYRSNSQEPQRHGNVWIFTVAYGYPIRIVLKFRWDIN